MCCCVYICVCIDYSECFYFACSFGISCLFINCLALSLDCIQFMVQSDHKQHLNINASCSLGSFIYFIYLRVVNLRKTFRVVDKKYYWAWKVIQHSSDPSTQIKRLITTCYYRFRICDRFFSGVSPVHKWKTFSLTYKHTHKTWTNLFSKFLFTHKVIRAKQVF